VAWTLADVAGVMPPRRLNRGSYETARPGWASIVYSLYMSVIEANTDGTIVKVWRCKPLWLNSTAQPTRTSVIRVLANP
jgi:hypothetical protein